MIGFTNLTNMSNVNNPKGMKRAVLRGGLLALALLALWAVIGTLLLAAPMGLGFLITRTGRLPFPEQDWDLWLLFQRGIIPAVFLYAVLLACVLWERVRAALVPSRANPEVRP